MTPILSAHVDDLTLRGPVGGGRVDQMLERQYKVVWTIAEILSSPIYQIP